MASEVRVPRLLRVAEVTERTGIERWRIYELVAQGKLPHLRTGKVIRISEEALVAWIQRQQKGGDQ
jgi:excisionase family DNA binding protein